MCEILFHGKRMDNGQWVEAVSILSTSDGDVKEMYIAAKVGMELAVDSDGNLHAMTAGPHIAYYRVDPNTVGQFTGLTDKNGRKIFEGDIVFTEHGSINEEDGNAVIEWDEDTARFVIKWDGLICDFDNFYGHDLEVIGNIYDNPELLEE